MKDIKVLQSKFLELLKKYCTDDRAIFLWHELAIHYTETHRYYHNFVHIQSMMQQLEDYQCEMKNSIEQQDSLMFAIFYHDVIYDPEKTDNEHQSALIFKKVAMQIQFADTAQVMQMIEDTQTHTHSHHQDTNLLLDLDLSILGKAEHIYTDYCHNIRKEYQMYNDDVYYVGREKVLHHFLEQAQIYKTEYFYDVYETVARQNLQTELKHIKNL